MRCWTNKLGDIIHAALYNTTPESILSLKWATDCLKQIIDDTHLLSGMPDEWVAAAQAKKCWRALYDNTWCAYEYADKLAAFMKIAYRFHPEQNDYEGLRVRYDPSVQKKFRRELWYAQVHINDLESEFMGEHDASMFLVECLYMASSHKHLFKKSFGALAIHVNDLVDCARPVPEHPAHDTIEEMVQNLWRLYDGVDVLDDRTRAILKRCDANAYSKSRLIL